MGLFSWIGDVLGVNADNPQDHGWQQQAPQAQDPNIYNQPGLQQTQAGAANNASFIQALQGQSQGLGPSASQTMLSNAANQNAANAMAMAASQRGVSPGLALRQAQMSAQQGNQQAAAQGVAARQQEQMNAQGMLGGAIGQQQMAGLNQLQMGQKAAQSNQQTQLGQNQINAGISQGNQQAQNNVTGGILGGIASGITKLAMAGGGQVPTQGNFGQMPVQLPSYIPQQAIQPTAGPQVQRMADGGLPESTGMGGPQSFLGQFFKGFNEASGSGGGGATGPFGGDANSSLFKGVSALAGLGAKQAGGAMSGGAPNPMMGEASSTLPAEGGPAAAMPMMMASRGGQAKGVVPGQAKVPGDSLKNDRVPALLSPKEIVLPRSVTMAPDAPEKAAAFVRAILAKHKLGG